MGYGEEMTAPAKNSIAPAKNSKEGDNPLEVLHSKKHVAYRTSVEASRVGLSESRNQAVISVIARVTDKAADGEWKIHTNLEGVLRPKDKLALCEMFHRDYKVEFSSFRGHSFVKYTKKTKKKNVKMTSYMRLTLRCKPKKE